MDAEQVGKVIDKIAEKAGVAVEAIQPLAEEIVREVQVRGICWVVIGVVLCISAVAIWAKGIAPKLPGLWDRREPPMLEIFGVSVAIVSFVGGVMAIIRGIEAYAAPTLVLLGL